jgi:hypothetical protein
MAKSFYTTHSGAFFVSPGGQSEQGAEVKAAGYLWGALDIGYWQTWDDWHETVRQFQAAGIRTPVWGRVQNSSVDALVAQGALHQCATILDIEDEFKTKSPAVYEKEILAARAAHPSTREIVLSTVGWLYNDVDYTAIAHRPVLLQVFATDMHRLPSELQQVTNGCISHARSKGFVDIGVTFQTYAGALPSWYTFWGSKPRSLFTGDMVGSGQAWPQWAVP